MAMCRGSHTHIKRILAKGESSTASKHTVGMFLLEVQGTSVGCVILYLHIRGIRAGLRYVTQGCWWVATIVTYGHPDTCIDLLQYWHVLVWYIGT